MQFGFRTFMFFMLLLAMIVLSYPLLFKPLNAQRDAMVLDTQRNQDQLDKLSGEMAQTKDMPHEIDRLHQAIQTLESKLPSETEMDKVLQDVWKSAQANQLKIKSVRNGQTVEGASYNEQPVRIVVDGAFYPGFFRFLNDVEQMQRLTKIKQMKIGPGDAGPGSVSVDMELTVYYEPTKKVAVTQ